MNIKNSLALSILLLLGNVQHSQASEQSMVTGMIIGSLLVAVPWAGMQLYSTFYNTTARQFANLVTKSAIESEHNTKNHIADLSKHADELTNSTDEKEKVAVMEEAIKCMHGNNTKNANATKECIDLARRTVKARKEIAEKNSQKKE